MIKFAKCRDVKDPQRNSNDLNAGIDFFVPDYNKELEDYILSKNPAFTTLGGIIDKDKICIPPGVDILIPTGIKCQFPSDVALIQFTKSGVGAKKKLDCFNGVIDASYQGEPHIHLINHGHYTQEIYYGEKITQFVPVKVDMTQITVEDYYNGWFEKETSRKDKGFGSTGIN